MSGGIYTTDKSTTLLSLDDVDVNNLADGQALVYDSTSETFTNQTIDNELSGISTIANELIKKDGTNTSFVRAHILSTDSNVGGLTTQKTTFVNSQPPFSLPLSSIESKFDNGFYYMILSPNESEPTQQKLTITESLGSILVGIGVSGRPEERLHVAEGNVRIDNDTTQQLRFYDSQGGQTNESSRIESDKNGGGSDLIFYTRRSGS